MSSLKALKLSKYGFPFLIFVIGGSYGLKEFTNIRFQFYKRNDFVREVEKSGMEIKPSSELTLDKMFEKVEELDTTNWENKRGPRPWEEDNPLTQDAIERAKKLKEKREKMD